MVELFSKYKRVFVLLFSLFIFPTIGYSQNWLNGEGGATNDEALDITVGPSGEYYTTGYFTTNATFGTTVLSSSGNSDIFITKYNAAGIVQWAIKAGGSGADRGYSIKTDDAEICMSQDFILEPLRLKQQQFHPLAVRKMYLLQNMTSPEI